MYENGKVGRSDETQNKAILLNAAGLQEQIRFNGTVNRSFNLVETKHTNSKANDILSHERNMSYSFSTMIGNRLNDMSNVFKEKKFIQNIWPTTFTRESLERNVDEVSGDNPSEDNGKSPTVQ